MIKRKFYGLLKNKSNNNNLAKISNGLPNKNYNHTKYICHKQRRAATKPLKELSNKKYVSCSKIDGTISDI
ncbi:MAG: hypothetical protein WAR79_15285 [Melioribacteraceae bacterium]